MFTSISALEKTHPVDLFPRNTQDVVIIETVFISCLVYLIVILCFIGNTPSISLIFLGNPDDVVPSLVMRMNNQPIPYPLNPPPFDCNDEGYYSSLPFGRFIDCPGLRYNICCVNSATLCLCWLSILLFLGAATCNLTQLVADKTLYFGYFLTLAYKILVRYHQNNITFHQWHSIDGEYYSFTLDTLQILVVLWIGCPIDQYF